MRFGGLQRTSFSDYPGHVAAVAFTRGCNFRCPYCHNPALVCCDGDGGEVVTEEQVLQHLRRRRGRIEGLVITGGEPTLCPDLVRFVEEVKALDVRVKLDTNGSRPGVLACLLDRRLLDYVAMDVKAPLDKYGRLAGRDVDVAAIEHSIDLLRDSGIDHEFRTTAIKPLLARDDLLRIGELLRGSGRYVLQPFVPRATLDPQLADSARSFTAEELAALQAQIGGSELECAVR